MKGKTMEFINFSDIKNPETGKTFREENMEKTHNIPLGSLVEVILDGERNGLRLFVVQHGRDCDGTPLYGLSFDKEWKEGMYGEMFKLADRARIDFGYSEKCLKIIK